MVEEARSCREHSNGDEQHRRSNASWSGQPLRQGKRTLRHVVAHWRCALECPENVAGRQWPLGRVFPKQLRDKLGEPIWNARYLRQGGWLVVENARRGRRARIRFER